MCDIQGYTLTHSLALLARTVWESQCFGIALKLTKCLENCHFATGHCVSCTYFVITQNSSPSWNLQRVPWRWSSIVHPQSTLSKTNLITQVVYVSGKINWKARKAADLFWLVYRFCATQLASEYLMTCLPTLVSMNLTRLMFAQDRSCSSITIVMFCDVSVLSASVLLAPDILKDVEVEASLVCQLTLHEHQVAPLVKVCQSGQVSRGMSLWGPDDWLLQWPVDTQQIKFTVI